MIAQVCHGCREARGIGEIPGDTDTPGFEIRQMVIMDLACGLLAYEEVPAMEHMGLFGVEQMRPPAPVCREWVSSRSEAAFRHCG